MVAKTRAKTTADLCGIDSKELATPEHDALMLWLDENIGLVAASDLSDEGKQFRKAIKSYISKQIDAIGDAYRKCSYDQIEKLALDVGIKVVDKEWEFPIINDTSRSKFIIGFADMRCSFQLPVLYPVCKGETCGWSIYSSYGYSGHSEKFTDKCSITWKRSIVERVILYEVKPKIPSLGTLMRQLKLYESYIPCPICVVSPNTQYRKIIHEQGFLFLDPTIEYGP